ncbi:helix-turn-helix transcriptional regulator [Pseudonocardia xinjiangensis]|uniref:helix-turn-helix transcriptional regulator n=1 Tax=Pseudonocardia xinjiangensis TaxID=75289 RepID=UPI003D8EB197
MNPQDATGLGEFLRLCRARVKPQDCMPLTGGGFAERRRVRGLRRAELARLAGVSVDYYKRLEQGRNKSASLEVLDSLAAALNLDDAEREHLFELAGRWPKRQARASRPHRVGAATMQLLHTLDEGGSPAFVVGPGLDVLAHNRLAGALITDFQAAPAEDRNLARFVFLDPRARGLYPDWEAVATDTVAILRFDAGRHSDDQKLTQLIDELSNNTDEFRNRWSSHQVHRRTTGAKRYRQPLVGELTVNFQALTPSGEPDQTIFIYSTQPGSPSETSLRLLQSWLADPDRAIDL